MGDSLPRTPLKHRAKFDAASFILAGETGVKSVTVQTSKQTKTVNDMPTPCLSACGDNNLAGQSTS